jgi:hypothetical protein
VAYTPPGIVVNQVMPQQSTPPTGTGVRNVAVVARASQGPALSRITPDQIQNVYGDPTSPLTSSYPMARMLDLVARQGGVARAYTVNLIGVRAGFGFTGTAPSLTPVGYASVANLGASTFGLVGVGVYTGSRGNNLQAIVNAPVVQVVRQVGGGFGTTEVQQITFYGIGGTPTGTLPLLSFKGTAAGAAMVLTQMTTAAGLQTYLTGITTIGAGGVVVTALSSPTAGAYAYQVAFSGTTLAGQAQPLLALANTPAITGGTGTINVQSILIRDTLQQANVQQISAGQYDLSTPQKIYAALQSANPAGSPAAIVQPYNLSASPAMPLAGTYSLTGGTDGAQITSPAADTNGTIAYQLAVLATGAFGGVDFITSEYDAAAVLGSVQTFIGQAVPNNMFPKAVLGPQVGTSVATLTGGTYQTANSDRVVFVGNDMLSGTNPTNPGLFGSVDGPYIAGALAGLKAAMTAEVNLYNQPLAGVGSGPPMDSGTGVFLSTSTLNTLAGAGFTVLAYNPQAGRNTIRDLISTAPQVDQYGQPNRFMYFSERDAFDELAKALIVAFTPLLGTPAASPATVVTQFSAQASLVMAAYEGRYHTGATVSVNYNVAANVVTVNVGYQDRPPLNTIVFNLGPVAQAPAQAAA